MYAKLFHKILDSSIWLENAQTRIVWITLLAAMDQDGYAHFSAVENLAIRARVTTEEARHAIECFLAPDPNSENPENEGRRIERVPGGYMILNAKYYQHIKNQMVKREQTRLRVKKYREKHQCNKSSVTEVLPAVTSRLDIDIDVDTDTDISLNTNSSVPSSKAHEQVVITIQTKDGLEYPIYQEQVNSWKELFPSVDVDQQLRSMKAWSIVNKKGRKTKKGMLKFITAWLMRNTNGEKNATRERADNSAPGRVRRAYGIKKQ